MSAPARPARRDALSFVGQGTRPGCGLPLVLIPVDGVVERIVAMVPR